MVHSSKQEGTILAFSWRLIAFVPLSSSDVKIETIFSLAASSLSIDERSAQGKTFSFGGVKCMPNCIWDNYATEMDCVHCSRYCIQRISKIPKNVEARMNSQNFFCILILIIFWCNSKIQERGKKALKYEACFFNKVCQDACKLQEKFFSLFLLDIVVALEVV